MRTTMCFLGMAFWFPILVYLGRVRWETAPNKLRDEGNKSILFRHRTFPNCVWRGYLAWFLYARTPMKAGRAPCCSLAVNRKYLFGKRLIDVDWSC